MAKAIYSADSVFLPLSLFLPEARRDLIEAGGLRATKFGIAKPSSALGALQTPLTA